MGRDSVDAAIILNSVGWMLSRRSSDDSPLAVLGGHPCLEIEDAGRADGKVQERWERSDQSLMLQ